MTAEANGQIVIDESDQGECIDLEVSLLRRDGETQSRASLNNEVIEEYAELMLEGAQFPPVRAYFDGSYYWLSDGFHRVAAVELLLRETIRVEAISGSLTDAKWDSYKANTLHGLRRTPGDVRLTLSRAIHHERSLNLSNRELARQLHISERTVRRFRDSSPAPSPTPERLAIRNGKEYKIRTENIGKGPAAAIVQDSRQRRSRDIGTPALS